MREYLSFSQGLTSVIGCTGVIAALVVVITIFLYVTQRDPKNEFFYHLDVIFQELFFIPIVLAALWFGLRAGLFVSFVVSILLAPYIALHWEGGSAADLDRALALFVYVLAAAVLGRVIEREKMEQKRLHEAESLAAIGQSMAAVAHDLKAPLVSIGGFSQQVYRHLSEDSVHRNKLKIVIDETQRMEEMVSDMLAFSRPLKLERVDQDVAGIVRATIEMAEETARKRNVTLKSEVFTDFRASFDATRMREALGILVINAVEASPEGETVLVKAYPKGKSLLLEIIDCGCGIPLDKRDEIFVPFFTTKKEGLGLGLPTAKKIIEAHGGAITFESNPGKGVTFRAAIPV
jgi:signal transduction histidine kinase